VSKAVSTPSQPATSLVKNRVPGSSTMADLKTIYRLMAKNKTNTLDLKG
jgi:hypothetical protein